MTTQIDEYVGQLERITKHIDLKLERITKHIDLIRMVVEVQANDDGIWALPLNGLQSASEAYLQSQLRFLHRAIEGEVLMTEVKKLKEQQS